jgi:acyl dehydratase
MGKELYYEDVEINAEIPLLVKHPTTQQLVKWAGASEDFYPIHYDKDFALSQGLPGVIVQGKLKFAYLAQMILDWVGEGGKLRSLDVRYRGIDLHDEDLICKGSVTKKFIQGNEHRLECKVWTENPKGEKTTTGSAIIILPSKS